MAGSLIVKLLWVFKSWDCLSVSHYDDKVNFRGYAFHIKQKFYRHLRKREVLKTMHSAAKYKNGVSRGALCLVQSFTSTPGHRYQNCKTCTARSSVPKGIISVDDQADDHDPSGPRGGGGGVGLRACGIILTTA